MKLAKITVGEAEDFSIAGMRLLASGWEYDGYYETDIEALDGFTHVVIFRRSERWQETYGNSDEKQLFLAKNLFTKEVTNENE